MTKPAYALSSYPLTTEPLQQITGQIISIHQDGSLMAESQHNRGWHCRRAASCLLAPELGDTVLITKVENQLWVLAILERAEQQHPAEIHVPGDLTITSLGNLSMNSNGLNIRANTGNCHISEMQYSGESVSAWVSVTRLVGNQFESLWQTVTQLSNRLFRHTVQTEKVHAGQLDMQAENYARLHARQTIVTAKAMTKIDAEQIHIG
ncbi:DUF3540 domain-containing protein [Xenorhabdus nematophila]|uniref:DUF3540 domain-containing protein n=1 Tax=Xenorhabdus nematophila (strain ATCC 19061 / DSM 3370 / CCUG 14189 / LMG 1036 / NCIMB 9965 / AN6) TaxID=406817 RepID=D3VHD1_XENNA|nr:DUF3540 domain-containing protein [Xenorhabdus nematophila]CEE90039.1 conserved hypothetical protein [Xenorhabdus nematophila str. Anatoliense]CEF30001.1 conserved hypothetical protein [Xenorhabdus nematophila str. Websteri]AYA40076.1 DUF3540 domain-containing protein [Xenorhabdus nematophila]KHD29517.1 hypothetical protein LH67_02510 [Xenorhabdus nematophila]MBA0018723.1 DUF3540 domain-containing protein [Xenorhabdus nematophila]